MLKKASPLDLPYFSLASPLHMCKADARQMQGRSKGELRKKVMGYIKT